MSSFMQPLMLTLKGFRRIRDGLGLSELTLDLKRLAGDSQLLAIAGPNGILSNANQGGWASGINQCFQDAGKAPRMDRGAI
ncbi:MAG TPA: hypothetical protein VLA64_07795 [Azonexus sp.]|nr:hypothetical protein [Azonexus sp.]